MGEAYEYNSKKKAAVSIGGNVPENVNMISVRSTLKPNSQITATMGGGMYVATFSKDYSTFFMTFVESEGGCDNNESKEGSVLQYYKENSASEKDTPIKVTYRKGKGTQTITGFLVGFDTETKDSADGNVITLTTIEIIGRMEK